MGEIMEVLGNENYFEWGNERRNSQNTFHSYTGGLIPWGFS